MKLSNTMTKVGGLIKSYGDWLSIAALLLAALAVTVSILSYLNKDKPSVSSNTRRGYNTYEVDKPDLYNYELPDPKYPPPAKAQQSFYRTYDAGDLQYNVEWSTRNMGRKPEIGSHSFTVNLYNYKNKKVTISGESLDKVTIGCIARDNPYRSETVDVANELTFAPYETKRIQFGIDVSCMYLGTADGQYFWRIY